MLGSAAWTETATKNAKPTLTRMGTDREDSTGEAVKIAKIRIKGHRMGLSQAMIWASEKPTIQVTQLGMDCSTRLR